MNWEVVGAVAAIAAINIGITTFIMNWIRSDFKQFESELRQWNKDILKEHRDFHARMSVLEDRKRQG